MVQAVAILCVVGLAIGQVLFKLSAAAWSRTGSLFSPETIKTLGAALVLYGLTTVAWVWVLQKAELGKVYPFMALAFVLVPLASHFVLGERFQPQYFVGVSLIVIGIVIAVRA